MVGCVIQAKKVKKGGEYNTSTLRTIKHVIEDQGVL